MSRQAKKRFSNKKLKKLDKIQAKIQAKLKIEYMKKCDELEKKLKSEKNTVHFCIRTIEELEKENERLRAENYNLKHRGIFKRILGIL